MTFQVGLIISSSVPRWARRGSEFLLGQTPSSHALRVVRGWETTRGILRGAGVLPSMAGDTEPQSCDLSTFSWVSSACFCGFPWGAEGSRNQDSHMLSKCPSLRPSSLLLSSLCYWGSNWVTHRPGKSCFTPWPLCNTPTLHSLLPSSLLSKCSFASQSLVISRDSRVLMSAVRARNPKGTV